MDKEKKSNVNKYMYGFFCVVILALVGSMFYKKTVDIDTAIQDQSLCDVVCQIDMLHKDKAENMKVLMETKKEARDAKDLFINKYNKYKELQKNNVELYDKILKIVNEGSTNSTLESAKTELLGLSEEQEISPKTVSQIQAINLNNEEN